MRWLKLSGCWLCLETAVRVEQTATTPQLIVTVRPPAGEPLRYAGQDARDVLLGVKMSLRLNEYLDEQAAPVVKPCYRDEGLAG